MIKELQAIYTKEVTDFYGAVRIMEFGVNQKALVSYNGLVAFINGTKASLLKRHLDDIELVAFKEFLRQNCFEVGGYRVRDLKKKYLHNN